MKPVYLAALRFGAHPLSSLCFGRRVAVSEFQVILAYAIRIDMALNSWALMKETSPRLCTDSTHDINHPALGLQLAGFYWGCYRGV